MSNLNENGSFCISVFYVSIWFYFMIFLFPATMKKWISIQKSKGKYNIFCRQFAYLAGVDGEELVGFLPWVQQQQQDESLEFVAIFTTRNLLRNTLTASHLLAMIHKKSNGGPVVRVSASRSPISGSNLGPGPPHNVVWGAADNTVILYK